MFIAFFAAALVLAATPGPGVVYIVTRTLLQGRAAGVASVLGVACGNFANAVGAALGLAALLGVSALAFDVVKLAGATYLVWLGVRMLRAAPRPADSEPSAAAGTWRLFRDGAVVALLNPKTAIFFAAFLPQFMPAAPSGAAGGVLLPVALGAAFVATAACTDLAYVLLAAAAGPRLGRAGRLSRAGRWAGAATLIGLGLAGAWSGRPAATP